MPFLCRRSGTVASPILLAPQGIPPPRPADHIDFIGGSRLSESDPWTLAGTLREAKTWLGLAEDQGKALDDVQMGLAQGRLTVAMGLLVTGEAAPALELCMALARDVSNDRAKRVAHGVMGFAYAESGDLERARRVLAGLRLDAPDSVWTRRLSQALDAEVPAAKHGETGGFEVSMLPEH